MAEGGEEEEKKMNIGGDEKPNPLPPGFRFRPTDEEMIEYYLLPRLQGRPHVPNDAIIDDYVYTSHPDDLLLNGKYKSKGQDETWYFLSSRARKYVNGDRPSRSTDDGRGRWKASTGCRSAVTAGNVEYSFSVLSYYDGPTYKDEDKGKWLMRELTVPQYENKLGDNGDNYRKKTLDKFVMCKIYLTNRDKKNKRKVDEASTSGKCEETCPPASQPGPAETGQETAKPKISKRHKGKRPIEAATAEQAPPAPLPDRCPGGPHAGPTQPLHGGGVQARFGTTGYHHHHNGITGRPMAFNPHTSMPRPPMAFTDQMPSYQATPVAAPAYFHQAMMTRHLGPPADQAFRPPRPMTVPSHPVMQRQPETEEMRESRVYQQHMDEFIIRGMTQQQQQQSGNVGYAAQQPRPMPFTQQQRPPYFGPGSGFNRQHARPISPWFLPCNYHQPVEAGKQVQRSYAVPDSGAATTAPTETETEAAGRIGATNEGTGVRGDCNNGEDKGSVDVPTEEQPRLTAITPKPDSPH